MPGMGTIVNCLAILAGGLAGRLFGKHISESLRQSLLAVNGLAVIIIGIGGAMAKMLVVENGVLKTQGTMMMIGSLCTGIVIGELLHIEDHIEAFGRWLQEKSGNGGENAFVHAFVTASLTVCVGAMAVVGALQDGISGAHTTLYTKAILDMIIILSMTTSMGIGCIFSIIPIAIFEGGITVLSRFLVPLMTDAAMANLDFVGSVMILAVGINLIWGRKVRVGNLLPALVIAVIWALV